MSVAINESSNQVKTMSSSFMVSLTPKRIASFIVLQATLLGACAYFTFNHYVTPSLMSHAIHAKSANVAQQRQQVASLKQQTKAQVAVLAQRMGILTARMNRIDALGQRLATSAEYSEFDFTQLPAIGGPVQSNEIASSSELAALFGQMDSLLSHLDGQQDQLALLETVLLNHEIHADSRIEGRPIRNGWMSSLYGMRNDPFNGSLAMHKGVDFAGKEGGDVLATGAGVVSWAGKRYGYGMLIEIDHGAGLKTRYGHAKNIFVSVGDVVAKGEVIGAIGNSGRSTGPHVHYEVLNKDQQVNPRKYIYR
ncbi:MAG: M23 family metallopeptidase [Psychrobium sp.]|nr:M23 family metallopeptidase [Psychrobium sp.]